MLSAKQRAKLLERYRTDPEYKAIVDDILSGPTGTGRMWAGLAGVLTALLIYSGWPRIAPYVFNAAIEVRSFLGVGPFDWFVGAGFMLLGTLLYLIRCRVPACYGGLEIGVGLVSAVYVAHSIGVQSPIFGPAFAILAALYVIVRGYDNIYKALKTGWLLSHWEHFFFGKESPDGELRQATS
jgi:hypothetical protein